MQTEQAVIEEHLHGFCCETLEDKDVDVGIVTCNKKVFNEVFWVFFVLFFFLTNPNELP